MERFFENIFRHATDGLQNDSVFFYEMTDSTNTRAREYFLGGGDLSYPKLFVAQRQSAGRGTRGRKFESDSERGVYFTLLIDESAVAHRDLITPIAAISVIEYLHYATGTDKEFYIKWVNDVYGSGGKLSGILSERIVRATGDAAYAIGIGINLYKDEYPESIRDIASSVEADTGRVIDKRLCVASIAKELTLLLCCCERDDVIGRYERNMLKRGTEITVTDGMNNKRGARILGVDENLHLIVEYSDGKRASLFSADVSVRKR